MSYRVLFENGKYENSVEFLKKNTQNSPLAEPIKQNLIDECDLIYTAFNDVEKEYIENIISSEDYNVQINKNKKRLLEHFTTYQNAIKNHGTKTDGPDDVVIALKTINFDTILNSTIYIILLLAFIGISYSIIALIKNSNPDANPYQSASAITATICCIVFFMCISFLTLRKRIILTNEKS